MTRQVSNRHLTQVIHRPALQTLARYYSPGLLSVG
jgi:hypothetical protein